MDPVMIPIIALSIPVVAIIANTIKKMIALKEKQLEAQTSQTAEKAAQYAADKSRLEERVAVLERIITDQGYSLAKEIESLRTLPPQIEPSHEREVLK